MFPHYPGVAMLTLILLTACGALGSGPKPYNDLDGDFFDAPWPSDLRRTEAGGLDMSNFPNVDEFPLLEDYAEALENRLDGAGPNAPIYFRFQDPLDTDALPTPAESIAPGSPLVLVNIDPESPEYGATTPISWSFTEDNTEYQPGDLLAVAPLSGFPLRPTTTYAVYLTTDIARQDGYMAEVWRPDHEDNAYWSDLQDVLFGRGVGVEDIAIATVFTTSDPISELRELAATVKAMEMVDLGQVIHPEEHHGSWTRMGGRLYLPLWQHGDKPYDTEGGGFMYDADGLPMMYDWELTDFTIAVPSSAPPATGWPVVIYSHGTGGDDASCCYDDGELRPARLLTGAGFVVIGINQPLHGDRATSDTDPTWHSFNYLNLDAALSTFRQSALDLVYLAHLLSGREQLFDVTDGTEVALDPDSVFFMGHSQGGITGAMAAPFFGDDVKAMVLSGAGGGLSLSLVYREDEALAGQSAKALVSGLLELDDDEVLDEYHPIAGLVQHLAEVTDPLNISPYWFRQPIWGEAKPVHVLMTEGLDDEQTPPLATEALAAAAGVPILEPAATDPDAFSLRGLNAEVPPAKSNLFAFDGSSVSAALAQYPLDGHFAVFYNEDAALMYRDFLRSAYDSNSPSIGSDVEADDTLSVVTD